MFSIILVALGIVGLSVGYSAPIDAIVFRMVQMGITQVDLAKILGSRSRASEVLNRTRPLSIGMIARFRDGLGMSADVSIGPPEKHAA
jgi:HTH-type transcriptional regulator / antitoxin HigA